MARGVAVTLAVVLAFAVVTCSVAEQSREGMTGGPPEECIRMMIGAGEDCCRMIGGGGHWRHGSLMGMKDELDLTDAQVAKLRSMKLEREKRAIKEKANLKTFELELRELMFEDEIDVKAVDRKIDQIASQKAKIRKAEVHGMLEAKKVLTAEQRKKLKEVRGYGGRKHMRRKVIIRDE